MKKNKILKFPWYTFFLVLYAILGLLAQNLGQISSNVALRSIFVALFGMGITLFGLKIILRDLQRAGLAAALLALLFLSYGHVYLAVKNLYVGEFLIGRHRYLVLIWGLLFILGGLGVKKLQSKQLTENLNFILLVLLLFPIIQIFTYELKYNTTGSTSEPIERALPPENAPDVYYIILDGYGRSDVLVQDIEYDNSAFLADLEDLGFYVANCSQSNYAQTALSLSSSLNFNYLDSLQDGTTPETTDRSLVSNLVKKNQVVEEFMRMGYTTHAFQTEFSISDIDPVDYFYIAPQKGLNDFEGLLIETTAAIILEDAGFFTDLHFTADDAKYHRTLFTLDTLKKLSNSPGPDFVFAHIILPHQRFVFGPDGEKELVQKFSSNKSEYYSTENYIRGYKNQAIFASKAITDVVKEILENSPTPPIIIIQGDHGPSHFSDAARMGILNAYYFPEQSTDLYQEISPVNTFRLVFNNYFGSNYPLLNDVSYHSIYQAPYNFTEVPNDCK
jgi:hypothetical protein